ncbi:MAG TPA: prepilin-type N-terminal cleavage/methylation domain-containing protein [Elusimicrobiota bacterium]|nr:prepilin-type N-terminal cleavage/methylation domain-containing protein [Elusimicrobiota bacterium]
MRQKFFNTDAFTLIELMLVVAIIGLLAAIAIPKFANLVDKSKEAAARGKLGTMRSAMNLYYADNEGGYPAGFLATGEPLVPRYLDKVPYVEMPRTVASGRHRGKFMASGGVPCCVDDWFSDFETAWHYSLVDHAVRLNCTHTDSKGTTWSLW